MVEDKVFELDSGPQDDDFVVEVLQRTPPKDMVLVPVATLQIIRAQLEADRLIEQGRAMKGEIYRRPVRLMCSTLDGLIEAGAKA